MKHLMLTMGIGLSACATFDEGQAPDALVLTSSNNTAIERNGHTTITAAYKFDTFTLPADDVTWSLSDTNVATLSGAGHEIAIAAVAPGVTRITATTTELMGKLDITVLNPQVSSVAITPSAPSITAGSDLQLAATATYSDASTLDVTSKAIWISSDTTKATVDKGKVHTLAAGGITVRAVMDSSQSTALVTITP